MKEQPDNQWLEELLKKEEPYVDNDGFSKRVVGSLRKRKRMTWSAKRRLVKTTSIVVGVVASLSILSDLEVDYSFLQSIPPIALMVASAVGISIGIAGACIWIVTDSA